MGKILRCPRVYLCYESTTAPDRPNTGENRIKIGQGIPEIKAIKVLARRKKHVLENYFICVCLSWCKWNKRNRMFIWNRH